MDDQTHFDDWYKRAIIYELDVGTFCDGDDDGVGEFKGARSKLDHLVDLGVTCVWLTPFYPSPNRDNGYDVADYVAVDPRLGTLDDFQAFRRDARARGLRLMIDLVVNHTSDQHPWFQSARADPRSPYRDYYLWSDRPEPEETPVVFPGPDPGSVWTYDAVAGSYYRHRFYDHEPDLATGNPRVQAEIDRIIDFWLDQGVDAFRVDAAPHMGAWSDGRRVDNGDAHAMLKRMRSVVDRREAGIVLMGETDADPQQLAAFFGDDDELTMLLNFLLDNFLFLALARQQAEPIARALNELPDPPATGQWANFVRNLDELDLERLSASERQEVYRAFAPEPEMRIYGRGIRRRLAPMMAGDRRRIELALSLLLTLPGTPVIVYGDEIGMGDDLSHPERVSVRTPMQWSDGPNGGFSTAPRERLTLPAIAEGPFGFPRVNVAAQIDDPDSLLCRVRRMIQTLRTCPEFSFATCTALDVDHPAVLAHVSRADTGAVLAVNNFCADDCAVNLKPFAGEEGRLREVLSDRAYAPPDGSPVHLKLAGYGYRWFRIDEQKPSTQHSSDEP